VRQVLCPLVIGREAELETIRFALSRLVDNRGSVMLVIGEAGVGKSRLAREAAALAADRGALVLWGRAVAGGQPFRPFTEAFFAEFRSTGPPAAPELEPFRDALGRLVPEWAPDVASEPASEVSVLALGEAVVRLLRRLSGRPGCLLVLEDLHWADAETLAVVEYLADNLASEPVLCLGTMRSEGFGAADELFDTLSSRRVADVLELSRLDESEVADMACACLSGSPAPAPIAGLLRTRADGLPFLVEELLVGCVESGALVRTSDGWVAGERALPNVPRTFVGTVHRRLAALDDRGRLVLGAAALLGRHFDWSLLPALCDLTPEVVIGRLRRAVDAQLVSAGGTDASPGFRFRHALTREALLDELLPPERAALARKGAQVIETEHPELAGEWCELAAQLYERAGCSERAGELFLEVGRRALARGALISAEQAFERSAVHGGEGPLGVEAREALLAALAMAGKTDDVLAVGGELLRRLDAVPTDPLRRAGVHLRLAQAAVGATQWRTATEHVDATRRLARGSPDLPVLAHAEVLAAQVAIGQYHFAEARTLAERALDAAERLGWPEVACEALEVIGRVARLSDVDEAEQVFERARTLALEHGLTLWQLRALHELGTIDVLEGRSLTRLVETREMALRVGALATAAVAELHLAAMLSTCFDADGTFEAAGRCVEVSRRFHLGTLPAALVFLASSWAIRGDRDRAEAGIEEALRAGGDDPDVSGRTWAWVRAILSLLEEDHVRALAELDRGIEVMRPSGLGPHPFAGLWVLLHAVRDDDPDRPRAEIRALGSRVAVYNRAYLAYSDAVVLGRAGASDEAMKSLALAEERFAQSEGRDWLRQFALRLVAEAAIADGWGDPETWLRGCLGFFDRRGDLRIAAACRSLLRRSGAPVPRRGRGDATVPQGLRAMGVTSREMDVLALVAAGLSNRAIAERLCISPRTVETHVASLVRKMRVEGRQGLMALTTSGSPQP
jgi:DNA-binding CsgD family transcriptional regulator/tetratricopeptide (TPR) repeat protein